MLGLKLNARTGIFAGLIALSAMGVFGASKAQTMIEPPKPYETIDQNGVDLQSGSMSLPSPRIAVGPANGGLSYSATFDTAPGVWRHSTYGGVNEQSTQIQPVYPYTTVTVMGSSMTFTKVNGLYVPVDNPSATLVANGNILTLTMGDGSVAVFAGPQSLQHFLANKGQISTLTRANGEVRTFTYEGTRIQSITNNFGYQLHFDYDPAEWDRVAKVTALNNAIDACAPTAATCTYSRTWPSLNFDETATEQSVTDALNRTTRYFFSGVGYHTVTGIRKPSSASGVDVTITFGNWGSTSRVSTIANAAGTWTYGYQLPPMPGPGVPDAYVLDTTTTDPMGHVRTVGILSLLDFYEHRVSRVASITNGANEKTSYGYSFDHLLLSSIQQPLGNQVGYVHDDRGNIVTRTATPKPSSGLAPIITTASYAGNCPNPKTCNKPAYVIDARGGRTDFTYDSTHGGTTSIKLPAPISGAARPETRTSYATFSAWYKNGGGSIVQAATPVWLPVGTSTCVTGDTGSTGPTCINTANEAKNAVTYQGGSGSVASNLLPLIATKSNGTGTLTANTTSTYDANGDVTKVDGPVDGTGDTTATYYDAMRQVVGVVGPDPDDTGPLLFRAARTTYDLGGQPTVTEQGTTTSQSASAMSSFATLQKQETTYDASGRPVKLLKYGSTSTITRASQTSYDAAGRVLCSTVRMNQPIFASLPSSACTLGTQGGNGPDRITVSAYDNADRVTQVISGFGTAAARVEKAATYTANGLEATVADGNNNLTTYEYDGFDRLTKTRYPSLTMSGTSSTTDFEQLSYDVANNVTQQIKRGGQAFNFTYDALNRANNGLRGETFAYDNLGRPTAVTLNTLTNSLTFDALGRLTQESMFGWITAYQYDKADRRTRITWPDGFYAGYAHDNTGAVTTIKENGSATLATYGYDNLGMRASLARADGVNSTYTYNGAARLSVLNHVFPVGADSQQFTLTYHNGDQVKQRTGSNAAYDWTGLQQTRSYGVNGLNQMTSAGSQTLNYNARGNLSSDGVKPYYYDVANNLTGVSTNFTQTYDPTGRVWLQTASGVSTVMIYSGQTLIAEHNDTGTLLRRYVPGPGIDEPLAWYEYGGTTSRRFFIQDEQGSVVAVTNGAGGALARNTYDEYGVPAAGNLGRYQYTGQTWIPQIELYHYKARVYSPTLGRFLQTDPSGYDDGLNWYAYVGNDPLNNGDPTGLLAEGCNDIGFGCAQPASAEIRQAQTDLRTEIRTNVEPVVNQQMGSYAVGVVGTGLTGGAILTGGAVKVAIGAGTGAVVNGGASALSGNSPGQIAVDTAKGAYSGASTSTGGFIGGTSSRAGQAIGEGTAAFAAAKATGGSNFVAGTAGVASATIGFWKGSPAAASVAGSVGQSIAVALEKKLLGLAAKSGSSAACSKAAGQSC